jgi:hypothetical protein
LGIVAGRHYSVAAEWWCMINHLAARRVGRIVGDLPQSDRL